MKSFMFILKSYKTNTPLELNAEFISVEYVEIKCQLDATEVFIADLIACSTCFGHLQHPANRTHNPQLHTRPAT